MEHQQQQEPEILEPNDLADLRRNLKQLENISADHLYSSTTLVTHRHKTLDIAGQEVYFNDLVTDSEHVLRSINRLTDRLRDSQDNLELQHHETTEKRLRILTILSATVYQPFQVVAAGQETDNNTITLLARRSQVPATEPEQLASQLGD